MLNVPVTRAIPPPLPDKVASLAALPFVTNSPSNAIAVAPEPVAVIALLAFSPSIVHLAIMSEHLIVISFVIARVAPLYVVKGVRTSVSPAVAAVCADATADVATVVIALEAKWRDDSSSSSGNRRQRRGGEHRTD